MPPKTADDILDQMQSDFDEALSVGNDTPDRSQSPHATQADPIVDETEAVLDEEPTDEEVTDEEVTDEEVTDEEVTDEEVLDPPEDAAPATDSALEQRLAALEAQRQAEEAAAEEPEADESEEVFARAQALVDNPESVLTEDEIGSIDTMGQDWPEVKAGVDAASKAMMARFSGTIAQMHIAFGRQINQLQEQVQALQSQVTTTSLSARYENIDQLKESIGKWIDKQPSLLQSTLKDALKSKDEAVFGDLVDVYNKAQRPAPKAGGEERPAQTRSNVTAMAPVRQRRTSVPTSIDPDDMEGAFAEAVQRQQ